jgi:hypothetical protein
MRIPLFDRVNAEPQTLDEIRDWHGGIVDALLEQRASILDSIRQSATVGPRFVGLTAAEADAYFSVTRRELDRLTMLNLAASAEASLKVDYFRRVEQKLKGPLSVAYWKWHKNR